MVIPLLTILVIILIGCNQKPQPVQPETQAPTVETNTEKSMVLCQSVEPSSFSAYDSIFMDWDNYEKSAIENEIYYTLASPGSYQDDYIEIMDVPVNFEVKSISKCSSVVLNPSASGLIFESDTHKSFKNNFGVVIHMYDLELNESFQDDPNYMWCSQNNQFLILTKRKDLMEQYFDTFYVCT